MINVDYALQTCDVSVRDPQTRYCGATKSEITKKCVTSFFNSVRYVANTVPDTSHRITIFDDHSTQETVEYLKLLATNYTQDNIKIEFVSLDDKGIMSSIRSCYEHLETVGTDLVYQIQDDYLFTETGIFEMIDIWMKIYQTIDVHSFVISYSHPYYWAEKYKCSPISRMIVPGKNQYWFNSYEIPCTFLASKMEFSKHWDLYEKFLNGNPYDSELETDSIHKILQERNVPCMVPFQSVGLHMQSEFDKDPYIDWKSRWDSVQLIK